MARVYYVDSAIPSDRKKRGKHKTHVVFDGSRVFKVKKLTELEDASEIHIDALFSEMYDEVLELLRRGVKVYLLKDISELKKLRMENNVKKSDENDAVLLAQIPREKFRLLTVEELEFKMMIRPLINHYEQIVRWRATLKRLMKRGFNHNFEEVIRLMERDRMKLTRKIIKIVSNNTVYREACKMIGVNNSVELAILVMELPLHLSLRELRGLLGLFPGRNEGRYNHRLRQHLARFASSLYIHAKGHANVSDKVVEIINRLSKNQAIYKLELLTLKALRIAYLKTAKPLADG